MKDEARTQEEHVMKFELDGANCSHCAHAIEHIGKKFAGVHSIEVDRAGKTIDLRWDGNEETPRKIVDVVHRIGYTAVPLPR